MKKKGLLSALLKDHKSGLKESKFSRRMNEFRKKGITTKLELVSLPLLPVNTAVYCEVYRLIINHFN